MAPLKHAVPMACPISCRQVYIHEEFKSLDNKAFKKSIDDVAIFTEVNFLIGKMNGTVYCSDLFVT